MKNAVYTDLESFSACCWPIVAATRGEIQGFQRLAERHAAGSATLNTCQRLEVYAAADFDCGASIRLGGPRALQHLAEVAAGLHSAVLGEHQVLGQVRSAIIAAEGPVRELGEVALAAARELRREVSFDVDAGNLLDRALGLSRLRPGGRLLVVGAGSLGRLVAGRGLDLGFDVTVAGRRTPGAGWLDGRAYTFVHLPEMVRLVPVDVAVGCLGSGAAELELGNALPAVNGLVVDLGTPRNFTGEASAPVVTIAALLECEAAREKDAPRRAELQQRLAVLVEKRLAMAAEDRSSLVGSLRFELEIVRQREMERVRRLHPEIEPETLDVITRSLVNQLFHRPSERLKRLNDPALSARVAALFSPASHDPGRTEP